MNKEIDGGQPLNPKRFLQGVKEAEAEFIIPMQSLKLRSLEDYEGIYQVEQRKEQYGQKIIEVSYYIELPQWLQKLKTDALVVDHLFEIFLSRERALILASEKKRQSKLSKKFITDRLIRIDGDIFMIFKGSNSIKVLEDLKEAMDTKIRGSRDELSETLQRSSIGEC